MATTNRYKVLQIFISTKIIYLGLETRACENLSRKTYSVQYAEMAKMHVISNIKLRIVIYSKIWPNHIWQRQTSGQF